MKQNGPNPMLITVIILVLVAGGVYAYNLIESSDEVMDEAKIGYEDDMKSGEKDNMYADEAYEDEMSADEMYADDMKDADTMNEESLPKDPNATVDSQSDTNKVQEEVDGTSAAPNTKEPEALPEPTPDPIKEEEPAKEPEPEPTPEPDPEPTPTPPVPDNTPEPEPEPVPEESFVYADGTYSATGNYSSPGGAETLDVTITIDDDIIVGTSATAKATRPISLKKQNEFIANYQSLVVGKSVDSVSLDKVASSSLTPKGFNDALAKIKSQAKN